MATVNLKGSPIVETAGSLPATGSSAPEFQLVGTDLGNVSLNNYQGKNIVLNIFPSVDTPVCAESMRRFNKDAAGHDNTVVLCVSADLPFAQKRFCAAEGLENVACASNFRDRQADTSKEFGHAYGVLMTKGPLAGLLARAVVVVNGQGKVSYTELVPEIAQEPNYEAALNALS